MRRPDLIEAGEAAAVVGAILWLAQTILETLQPGKLADWLRQVGLAGAIGELEIEVERMETVVDGVNGRAVGNKPLARCLARVKELMYDADDVVDELDYFRLQQQVQGVMIDPASDLDGMFGDGGEQVDASANTVVGDGAEHVDASASTAGISDKNDRKNRSKERDYFHITQAINGEPARAKCIDCGTQVIFSHGTSVLRKHRNSASCKKKRAAIEEAPNCPSAGDSVQNGAMILTYGSEGRKRMRTEGNVATITPPWDKAKFSERINEIALEFGSIRGYVIEYLKDSVASPNQYESNAISDAQVRTSGSLHGKVYGRDMEKERIMSLIKDSRSDIITVLPIVGIVGVGKTTLAKFVYNDPNIESQFERIWVWVSNIFDKVRVIREILDVVSLASHEGSRKRESYEGVSNYSKLLEVLKKHMPCLSKKFLLVLDDVCCMDNSQWKDLIDALGSSCRKGNVIIVTTRNLSIAQRLATAKPVELRALKEDDFWVLFKACAFGDNNYKEHLAICHRIARKLNGNPLAAESAADMLREQPTLHHWKSILKNGVWESLQLRGGIVTALKISYHLLPYHLQQCLLFCSMFPNGHWFHIDDLVSMWISSGFVKSVEVVQDYLNALVNSGFFELVETEDSIVDHKKCYVLCGIMHEFARLVSRAEFATVDGLECKELLPTVRHFSILLDSVCYRDFDNGKVNEKLKSIIPSARRLRTLIILTGNYVPQCLLRSFHTFICSLVNCTHLRYLKVQGNKMIETLPISLSNFYHLQVLDFEPGAIIIGTSDLVNMRNLVLSNIAWFSRLKTIYLENCEGWKISLEGLSRLTKLKLKNMHEVTDLSIPSLEELVLIDMPNLYRFFSNSVRDLNSNLRILEMRRCLVLKVFPLFESCENFGIEQKSWLPNVSELSILECPRLMISNPLPPSSGFCKLLINDVSTLPRMYGPSNGELRIGYFSPSFIEFLDDKILSFHNLRTITQLKIVYMENLISISLEGFRQLVCLKRLEIKYCTKFFSSNVPSGRTHEDMAATDVDALPSLECLSIKNCGITGEWLSVMLQHVRALEELRLCGCEQITGLLIEQKENSLSNLTLAPHVLSQVNADTASTRSCPDKLLCVPLNLIPSLKKMSFKFCELNFLGNKEGFSGFTSLEELRIVECPYLAHGDEINDQANRLLPCSLGVLDIRGASLGMLQPCFPGDLIRLKVLEVWRISELKSLQLHSYIALEKLKIGCCRSLDTLEGVQSLRSLRYLKVHGCPGLTQCLESLWMQGYELCPRLERLQIDDPSFLTSPFCKHLTSLQCLRLKDGYDEAGMDAPGLTCKQEAALQLLTSLQEIRFQCCRKLSDLPVGLHSLLSLKRLVIDYCPNISRLPERGLPTSLEELEVCQCSEELTEQCRKLATSKLKVIIDGKYVD